MANRKYELECNSCKLYQEGSLFSFSAYDMALMYNCKLFKSSINKLCNCNFDYLDVVKGVLKDYIIDNSILNSLIFNGDDDFFRTCIRGSYFGYKDYNGKIQSDNIFLGFSPELIYRKIVFSLNPIENYLYGLVVNKKIINVKLLKENNIDYCEDELGFIYFPMKNLTLASEDLSDRDNPSSFGSGESSFDKRQIIDDCNVSEKFDSFFHNSAINNPCSAFSHDLERNLDICHSLITLHKMQVLISDAGEKIIGRLNQENLGVKFELGCNYNYVYPDSVKKIFCGCFIHMINMADSFYFGLSPNVFDEINEVKGIMAASKTKNPEEIIVSDYFSSVAMVITDRQSPDEKYINNGVEFAGNWVYFPVCRKLLCCNNFEELYINRVVSLIRDGVIKYFQQKCCH